MGAHSKELLSLWRVGGSYEAESPENPVQMSLKNIFARQVGLQP